MAFLVSPGVQVKEIDLTNVIPATSSSIAAIAAPFQWGPVDEIVTVGSEELLVKTFGQPSDTTFMGFLNAAQFLSYGNTLRTIRVVGTGGLNAALNATTLVKNDTDFANQVFGSGSWVMAKYPGVTGSALGVTAVTADWVEDSANNFVDWVITPTGTSTAIGLSTLFNSAPDTSSYAAGVSGVNDEVHVVVYDNTGEISGTQGTILETYAYLSLASDAKGADGTSNYWLDVINKGSDWVRFGNNPERTSNAGSTAAGTTFINTETDGVANPIDYWLANGNDGTAPTQGQLELGYDFFADAESVEISLLIQGDPLTGNDSRDMADHLIGIAESRKDCVAFVSPPVASNQLSDVTTWHALLPNMSSYAFADSTPIYVYDKYNDKYRWISASGSIAGLAANADNVADPWFSPAGFNRGSIRNVTKIAWNPTQSDRDDLYKLGINPIVSFPGHGTILFGDKTLQKKPSAFDRINVRRLFITLEKAVSTASKFQLFEFNDEFTRAQFRNMVEPFLRDIKGRRGITDFKVVCDETNNTGDIIDTNRFVADIYIKPARSINFITLNFVATRTGVEFSEIAGGN